MDVQEVIRPTARAVIRKGALVLVQVKRAPSGRRYLTLPGGRQDRGETAAACVARECIEEIGAVPRVGALLHLADVMRHRPDGPRHLVEMLFACTLPEDYTPRMGARPDKRQVDTIWADPATDGPAFFPRYDLALTRSASPTYLGRLDCVAP